MSDQIRQCPVCEEWFEVNRHKRGKARDNARFCSRKCVATWRTQPHRSKKWDGANPGEVPLGNGTVALVDIDDWERVKFLTWRLSSRADNKPYAIAAIRGRVVYLHRLVMGDPDGEIDHINLNRLDCRKSNLRVANRVSQSANAPLKTNNTSGYKGVSWYKPYQKWRATIQNKTIGYFSEKVEAALAYDKEARARFGEFARVNFPGDGERSAFVGG